MPTDKKQLGEMLEKGHEKLAAAVLSESVRNAELAIVEHLELVLKSTAALVKTLRPE
jgi:hypothetical protein